MTDGACGADSLAKGTFMKVKTPSRLKWLVAARAAAVGYRQHQNTGVTGAHSQTTSTT